MFGLRIKKTILVEINFPTLTVGGRYPFPDVPELRQRGVYINGIQAIGANTLTTSPSQKTICSEAALAALTVTFAVGDASSEDVQQYPCIDLSSYSMYGNIRLFNDKLVVLGKSYVTMLATGSFSASQSVCFNFHYYSN